jgi:opacity protein-like surface antigen
MRNRLALLVVCCLLASSSLCAGADILPPGTHELGGSAEIVFPENGSSIYLGPRFGIVFTPGSELEFEMGYSRTSDGLSNSRLAFLADFIYNFETVSAPYPFMLGGFGFARSHSEWERGGLQYDSDETNAMLNLGAGLRLPITESSLIRLELRYTREFASPDVSTTALRAGLSLLLH